MERARAGKIVARLKGGDPFIFGRGGEEAEDLAAAGVPFEVVPGVTSAVAAPAYAGIPLTHRDFTSTVAFVTGHEDPTKADSGIAWDKIATGIGTLVFFMGVGQLPEIVRKLMEHGRAPETPAAVIRWGTRADQEVVTGTLRTLVERSRGMKPPALIVVGEVVALREKLRWVERKPLFGRRILITRAREQASAFAQTLEAAGAEVVEFPTIRIVPPESWAPLDAAIGRLREYQWAIFTSANGVRFFWERLTAGGEDARDFHGITVCAIGPATAAALLERGLRADLVPGEFTAEALVEAVGSEPIRGARILLARAAEAREVIPEELSRRGAAVDVVPAYRTVKNTSDADRASRHAPRGEDPRGHVHQLVHGEALPRSGGRGGASAPARGRGGQHRPHHGGDGLPIRNCQPDRAGNVHHPRPRGCTDPTLPAGGRVISPTSNPFRGPFSLDNSSILQLVSELAGLFTRCCGPFPAPFFISGTRRAGI